MKKLGYLIILLLLAIHSKGQDKKEIVEFGIQVKRNYEVDFSKGNKEPWLEKEEFYNFRGDLVEIKEYKDEGKTLSLWVKYKYNAQGKLVEETMLNAKGEQNERYEYKYENGLKSEKLYYDSKNRLYKKKQYKYELRK